MIATLVAALLAGALPTGTAWYRAELGNVPVGVSALRIACGEAGCEAEWGSRLRLPDAAGGGIAETKVIVEVDRDGRYRGGALRVRRGDVRSTPADGLVGAVPASLAEVVLAAATPAGSEEICFTFFDEERPSARRACARREAGGLAADLGGVAVRIVPGADGFPAEVVVGRRFRYVRDPAPRMPLEAPRLAGTRVPGPSDPGAARSFCGVAVDPPADDALAAALPPPVADGESCREKTAHWLAAARALGFEGRTAVGVAWDGEAFVWHAWAEVRQGDRWIPLDPSFRQRPARGPRFTVGRHAKGDDRARDAAGARILECWGSARVE